MGIREKGVTTAIILEKRVTDKDGKHPVKLRITFNRKRKYYTLRTDHLTVDEFEKIMRPDSRGRNKERRKEFEAVENRAIYIIENVLNEFSFEEFEREYTGNKGRKRTLQDYFKSKIEELEADNKFNTANTYRSAISTLLKYDANVSFDKITPRYLKEFEQWYTERGNSYTTMGIYMRNLRHILNLARQDRVISAYPFGRTKDKYQIPASKNKKKALTIEEISLLFKYQSEDEKKTLSLKYWLFSYLCNGMNFVDILNLKYSDIDGDSLHFIRQKTKNTSKQKTQIEVILLPEAKEIIKQIGNKDRSPGNYIFPVLNDAMTPKEKYRSIKNHIRLTNLYLKQVAGEIGIDPNISTYYARHSYSTIIRNSGASIDFVAEQLGHRNIKVTQNYLDSFTTEIKKKYQQNILPTK